MIRQPRRIIRILERIRQNPVAVLRSCRQAQLQSLVAAEKRFRHRQARLLMRLLVP